MFHGRRCLEGHSRVQLARAAVRATLDSSRPDADRWRHEPCSAHGADGSSATGGAAERGEGAMSEFDDSGSSGRKGFVRDVMRRISASGPRPGDEPEREGGPPGDAVDELQDALRFFGPDSAEFRRRLERALAEYEAARRRYQVMRQQLVDAERQNEKLVHTLQEAKQQIELLKEEVDKLCA